MFTAVAVLAAYVFDGNDATAARHWELTGVCWPIGNDNEAWMNYYTFNIYNYYCIVHAELHVFKHSTQWL